MFYLFLLVLVERHLALVCILLRRKQSPEATAFLDIGVEVLPAAFPQRRAALVANRSVRAGADQ